MGNKKACKKEIEINKEDAKFECKKCGNTAKKEKHLCKPIEIDKK